MPLHSNPLAAFNQSQTIADTIANAGQAFSPVNTMQYGLLQAKQKEIEANIQNQSAQLGLNTQELGYKKGVYAAQANNNNAEAAYHNAQARSQDIVGQQLQLQTKAMSGLGSRLMAAGVSEPEAMLGQDLIISGSSKSTSENNADAINKILQRSPVILPQGGSAILHPSSPLLPQNQPQAPSAAPQSLVPQSQIPFAQGGFGAASIPPPFSQPQAAQPTQAPSLGAAVSSLPQNGPVFSGNVVAAPGTPSRTMTPGQKSVDEQVGKEYGDTLTQGKLQDASKQIQNLDFALENLRTKKGISGGVVGYVPDSINRNILGNNAAVDTRQSIEDSVQRGLRAVLGAQFTENEGKRLIERAYDPTATQEENLRRVGLLTDSIKKAYQAKLDAFDYFTKNGTMTGYTGEMPSLASIEASSNPTKPAASGSGDELVSVTSPDGRVGKIPKSKLQSALSRGFKAN